MAKRKITPSVQIVSKTIVDAMPSGHKFDEEKLADLIEITTGVYYLVAACQTVLSRCVLPSDVKVQVQAALAWSTGKIK